MSDTNRRKYLRVNYPCQLTLWLPEGPNGMMLANTSNVGLGGLCVRVNQEILVGTKVDIQLDFTHTPTPFRCCGKVTRSMQLDKEFNSIGIEFESLSEPKHTFLRRKISELIDLTRPQEEIYVISPP
jgi:hypothetical protein